jgi:hypothetical protein
MIIIRGVCLAQDIPAAKWELLEIHATPLKPGHVRLIVRFFFAGAGLPLGMRLAAAYAPEWLSHINALDITDGDLVLLEYQVGVHVHMSHHTLAPPFTSSQS